MIYVHILLANPQALTLLGALLLGGLIAIRPLARISNRSVRLTSLTWLAISVVIAVTMAPVTAYGSGSLNLTYCAQFLFELNTVSAQMGLESWLNFALYMPAGFFLAKFLSRAKLAICALVVLSFLIELTQGLVQRSCTPSDWLMNSFGAFSGAVIAAGITRFVDNRRLAGGDTRQCAPTGD